MRASSDQPRLGSRPRASPQVALLAIAGAFLAIACVGVALTRASFIDATRWVQHTSEVRLAVARARIAVDEGDLERARQEVDTVRMLTSDNPRQQARLARFGDLNAQDARAKFDALANEEEVLLAVRSADEAHKRTIGWFVLGISGTGTVAFTLASLLFALRARRALANETALLESVVDGIGDAVVAIDRERRFLVANAVFRSVFADGLMHGRLAVHATDRQDARQENGEPLGEQDGPLARALRGDHVDGFVFSVARVGKHEERLWFSATSRIDAAVAVLRDVTRERRDRALLVQQAEELRQQSLVDELTGLYNRRGFLLLSDQYTRTAARSKRAFAILFADLNGLKTINDTVGHDAGDEAIRRMGRVLKSTLRDSDIVARLGGDEFVALLDGADDGRGATAIARIERELATENARDANAYSLSVSLGVAESGEGEAQTIEALVALADARMYARKKEARGGGAPRGDSESG